MNLLKTVTSTTALATIFIAASSLVAQAMDPQDQKPAGRRALPKIPDTAPVARTICINLNNLGNSESVDENVRRVHVVSKNDGEYTFQLQSDPLNIQAGKKLKVPYDVTVESGEVRFGLLQTNRYGFLKDIILGQGHHIGTLDVIVPEGETTTWVEFIKQAGKGQANFTVNAIDFTQEEPLAKRLSDTIKVNLNNLGNSQSVNQDASRVQVTSKDDQEYTYQLQSDSFNIQAGQRLTVPYDVAVQSGEVRLGLLQTNRYGFLKDIILGQGQHRGTLEVIVPEGETTTWVEFIKQESKGQAVFTVNGLDFFVNGRSIAAPVVAPVIAPVIQEESLPQRVTITVDLPQVETQTTSVPAASTSPQEEQAAANLINLFSRLLAPTTAILQEASTQQGGEQKQTLKRLAPIGREALNDEATQTVGRALNLGSLIGLGLQSLDNHDRRSNEREENLRLHNFRGKDHDMATEAWKDITNQRIDQAARELVMDGNPTLYNKLMSKEARFPEYNGTERVGTLKSRLEQYKAMYEGQ